MKILRLRHFSPVICCRSQKMGKLNSNRPGKYLSRILFFSLSYFHDTIVNGLVNRVMWIPNDPISENNHAHDAKAKQNDQYIVRYHRIEPHKCSRLKIVGYLLMESIHERSYE